MSACYHITDTTSLTSQTTRNKARKRLMSEDLTRSSHKKGRISQHNVTKEVAQNEINGLKNITNIDELCAEDMIQLSKSEFVGFILDEVIKKMMEKNEDYPSSVYFEDLSLDTADNCVYVSCSSSNIKESTLVTSDSDIEYNKRFGLNSRRFNTLTFKLFNSRPIASIQLSEAGFVFLDDINLKGLPNIHVDHILSMIKSLFTNSKYHTVILQDAAKYPIQDEDIGKESIAYEVKYSSMLKNSDNGFYGQLKYGGFSLLEGDFYMQYNDTIVKVQQNNYLIDKMKVSFETITVQEIEDRLDTINLAKKFYDLLEKIKGYNEIETNFKSLCVAFEHQNIPADTAEKKENLDRLQQLYVGLAFNGDEKGNLIKNTFFTLIYQRFFWAKSIIDM